jgi:hypothetical protein
LAAKTSKTAKDRSIGSFGSDRSHCIGGIVRIDPIHERSSWDPDLGGLEGLGG